MTRPVLFYQARRHPALDRAGFVARWRQHGALGMAQPRWRNIARYVQADALPLDHPRADTTCDGVAIVSYRSEAHRLAHVADAAAGPILKRDELETFDRPVAQAAMLTTQTVHCAGPARYALFAFSRSPGNGPASAVLPAAVTCHSSAVRRIDGPRQLPFAALEMIGANDAAVLAELAAEYAEAPVSLVLTELAVLYSAADLTSCR